MSELLRLTLLAFPVLAIWAACRDAISFTIPNWISAALGAAFFVIALLAGMPLAGVGISAAIGFGALAVGVAMFALGWIGGGDAKLLAACALWMGLPALLPFLLVTALAGGGLAVLLMTLRADLVRPYLAGGPAWFVKLSEPGAGVPYGVAIAAGALAAFPQSPLVGLLHGV